MITAEQARAATEAAQNEFFKQPNILAILSKIENKIQEAIALGQYKFSLNGDDAKNFLLGLSMREIDLIENYLEAAPLSFKVFTAGGRSIGMFSVVWEQQEEEDSDD